MKPEIQTPLRLRIRPSLILAAYFNLLHLWGLMLLLLLPLSGTELTVALILLLISWISRWRTLVRGRQQTHLLERLGDGNWRLLDRQQRQNTFNKPCSRLVTPRLLLLSFPLNLLQRRHVILLPDNVDQEVLRRLRVRLMRR